MFDAEFYCVHSYLFNTSESVRLDTGKVKCMMLWLIFIVVAKRVQGQQDCGEFIQVVATWLVAMGCSVT